MATNEVQSGKIIDYANNTGSAIATNQAIVIGNMVAVALVDIADGETGACATEGVFEITKASTVTADQGEVVVFGASTGAVKATAAAGDIENALVAFEPLVNGETTAVVKLTGPGTVKA